jgi:triosephosphate isomerase
VQTLVDGDKYRIRYGAQDVSPHPPGAHTGDIAASMLAKLGCDYVVVGHSERRADHGEDDALVNAKVKAALAEKLVPILCVGEPLQVRQEGGHVGHCVDQLAEDLAGVPAEQARTIVIAYEPVWAIGTGEVATPDDAQEVCAAIRTRLAELYSGDLADGVRILYGGSVKAANVAGIMAQEDVDGALVGGASIDPDEFVGIVRYRTSTEQQAAS